MWPITLDRKTRSVARYRPALTARPQLERLEDRCLMTAGQLDTTFGSGGSVVTAVGPGNDHAEAVRIQPDGKIVVAGQAQTSRGLNQFAVVRYTTSGSLDASFGTGGKVTTTIVKSKGADAFAMAL